jgi:hypothetical protein
LICEEKQSISPSFYNFWTISYLKKIIIAAAISTLFANASFAAPPVVTVGAGGGVGISNTISGGFSVANGGSSESQAMNSQAATATSTSTLGANSAAISGATTTTASSFAWNISNGGGAGNAASMGSSGANASGFTTVNGGGGSGNLTNVTNDNLVVGSNQGGWTASMSGGSLGSSQASTLMSSSAEPDDITATQTSSVGVSSTLNGDVWGATGSGVLTVDGTALNAPNVSNVTASGSFNANGAIVTGEAANATLTNDQVMQNGSNWG